MSSKTKCFHAISADNFAFTRQMDILAGYPQNTTSVLKGNRGNFVWLSGVLSQQLNTIRQKYNPSELDIPNDSGTICGLREKKLDFFFGFVRLKFSQFKDFRIYLRGRILKCNYV